MNTKTFSGNQRDVMVGLHRWALHDFEDPIQKRIWCAAEHIVQGFMPDKAKLYDVEVSVGEGSFTFKATEDTRGAEESEPTKTTK
jgi:hypothetical protein